VEKGAAHATPFTGEQNHDHSNRRNTLWKGDRLDQLVSRALRRLRGWRDSSVTQTDWKSSCYLDTTSQWLCFTTLLSGTSLVTTEPM
jgi:hypothetical protein